MAKKKSPKITLEGLDDINFDKNPDIDSALSIIQSEKEKAPEKIVEAPPTPKKEVPAPIIKEETPTPVIKATPKPKKTSKKVEKEVRGTLPPANKKRASFNIDADLHRALKDYSFFNEIEMVEYVFEQLVKVDLKKKGYYPPRKRK